MRLKLCLLVMEASRPLTLCPPRSPVFLIETVSYSTNRNGRLAGAVSCSRRRWEDRACGVRQCDFNSHCASSTSACSKRCSDDLSVQAGLLAAGLLRFDGIISCGVKELSKVVDNFFLVLP